MIYSINNFHLTSIMKNFSKERQNGYAFTTKSVKQHIENNEFVKELWVNPKNFSLVLNPNSEKFTRYE